MSTTHAPGEAGDYFNRNIKVDGIVGVIDIKKIHDEARKLCVQRVQTCGFGNQSRKVRTLCYPHIYFAIPSRPYDNETIHFVAL